MKRNKYAVRQLATHSLLINALFTKSTQTICTKIYHKPTSSLTIHKLQLLPVLVTPRPHVLHSSKTTGNSSISVQVLQYGAAHLQVIWISGCLQRKFTVNHLYYLHGLQHENTRSNASQQEQCSVKGVTFASW